MSTIILDASKNQKYVEEHGDLIEENMVLSEDEAAPARERKIREVYIPPEEKEQLLALYTNVVVQDFEDEYHMSKEDRENMRAKYEKFFRLKKGFTKKIRRLDKYVEACRLCMGIIRDTAATNGIYDPEEFELMALKGKVQINGLNFPKFQGKGKKFINWDYVAEFIVDDTKDIYELIGRPAEPEDEKRSVEELFDQGEYDYILTPRTEEEAYVEECKTNYLDPDQMGNEYAADLSKKDKKHLAKIFPNYMKIAKEMNKASDGGRKDTMIWQIDREKLQFIEEYDAKVRGAKAGKNGGIPVFKGEMTNQTDVDRYLYAMEQWEDDNTFVQFNGRWITRGEMEDIKVKQMLEESGWNLRNLYDNKEREKRLEKAKANDKKRIKKLKQMLAEIQERSDKRDKGEDVTEGINKKKKKKDKKAKKKAKGYDEIILDAAGADDENMKMYKKRMESMKWGEK